MTFEIDAHTIGVGIVLLILVVVYIENLLFFRRQTKEDREYLAWLIENRTRETRERNTDE